MGGIMKTFSMGEALASGFEMIAKRPLAVLLWGVLLYLPGIAGMAAIWPFMGAAWADPAGPAPAGRHDPGPDRRPR